MDNLTAEDYIKAFEELRDEASKNGNDELFKHISYRIHLDRFEIVFREIVIGAITIGTKHRSAFIYATAFQTEISEWDMEFDTNISVKEILEELIETIYVEHRELADFEELICSSLVNIVDSIEERRFGNE